jgi:2',3'-cyclic-nucleotide 2'-phosphodiesterase (5'-nucleotidase family)
VTDRLRAATGADVCVYIAHGLVPALDPGPVTRWDLWRAMPAMLPSGAMVQGDLVAMTVTGNDLTSICKRSVGDLPCDEATGVPTRFNLPGNPFLQVSGLRMAADMGRPPGERVSELTVAGAALEPGRRYSVVTSGFLAQGFSGYRWLREGTERRNVGSAGGELLEALRTGGSLPDPDGRLQLGGI